MWICPLHDDRDPSLSVFDDGRAFKCFGCGKAGDVFAFIMARDGCDFPTAKRLLADRAGVALDDEHRPPIRQRQPLRPATVESGRAAAPAIALDTAVERPEVWRAKVAAFVQWAADQLAGDTGADARAYLAGRGITPETARRFGLGFNPEKVFRDRSSWGIAEDPDAKKIVLGAGAVIPCYRGGELWRVRIRRPDWRPAPADDNAPKYQLIKGSSRAASFVVAAGGEARPVVVIESELDAVLLAQEAGDLVDVVALGDASNRPDADADALLCAAPLILVALDAEALDKPGPKNAWGFWLLRYDTARRWPPIRGKDCGEMFGAGVSLAAWAQAGIDDATPAPVAQPAPTRELSVELAGDLFGAAWAKVAPEKLLTWRQAIGRTGGGDRAARSRLAGEWLDVYEQHRARLAEVERLRDRDAESEAFILTMIEITAADALGTATDCRGHSPYAMPPACGPATVQHA